jgi:formamidopyrimidine-DNA glycosylase
VPELPEVESVRRGLADGLTGRTIARVTVLHPRPVRRHLPGPDDFAAQLSGRTFAEPRRRGKYLWLPFVDGDALLAHLGMSGQFRFGAAEAPFAPNTRVLVDFTDPGLQLRFVDQRMFGGLSLSEGGAELPSEIAHIARDPFDPAYDLAAVVTRLRRKRTGVKRALLDQQLVGGVGNIYADEALWRARLHYARATDTLSRPAAVQLLTAAAGVMAEALQAGGTSFDSLYVNVNGASGYFDRSLAVYGREGEPCPRCGSAIRREAFMNRSSFRCPRCQRTPSVAHARF